jgi:hypothetical protein
LGVLRALLVVLLVAAPRVAPAQDLEARARALHRDAIVVDGHNDVSMLLLDLEFDLALDGAAPGAKSPWPWFFLPWLPGTPSGDALRTDTDLARMEKGGLDAQFFSIWVDPDY